LEDRQLAQWLNRRRDHREKQQEADETVLDHDRQEGLVGSLWDAEHRLNGG